jgi:thioredoxin 2
VPAHRLGDAPKCGSCSRALFEGHPVALAEADFDRHLANTDLPVVVDFWAPWCGPCRVIGPVLDEIARELGDAVTIGKVNVDEQPALASRFGVQAIPQLMFFKDGALRDKVVGAVPKREIVKRLDALKE